MASFKNTTNFSDSGNSNSKTNIYDSMSLEELEKNFAAIRINEFVTHKEISMVYDRILRLKVSNSVGKVLDQ